MTDRTATLDLPDKELRALFDGAVALAMGELEATRTGPVFAAAPSEARVEALLADGREPGGPEALRIDAWARRLFAATGDDRTVIGDPHARYFSTELHGGELTTGDGARIGTLDFDAWLATHRQEAGR